MKSKIIFHKKGGPLGYFEKWQKFQKKIFSKTGLIPIRIDFRPFLEKFFFENFQNILRVPPSYEKKNFCQKKLFHYFSHTHRSPTKGLVQKKSQLSGWKTLITTFFLRHPIVDYFLLSLFRCLTLIAWLYRNYFCTVTSFGWLIFNW